MISTISGTLPPDTNSIQAVLDAFPMGSMTGAPKVMAMNLIERYEESKRGLYSGAVGYFDPKGDFDFNVVIRSLQYNSSEKYLSCSVGGAIVYESDPEQEYEECLTKMAAIQSALAANYSNT
jgi:para-aminobenzoate synthetase component 1